MGGLSAGLVSVSGFDLGRVLFRVGRDRADSEALSSEIEVRGLQMIIVLIMFYHGIGLARPRCGMTALQILQHQIS